MNRIEGEVADLLKLRSHGCCTAQSLTKICFLLRKNVEKRKTERENEWDILLCSRTQGIYPVPMGLPFPILTVKVHLVEIDSAWSYKATRMIKRFSFLV